MKSISKKIAFWVSRFERGRVFSVRDLGIEQSDLEAAHAALSRLCEQGVILRVDRGLYSKPLESNFFGKVAPGMDGILGHLLSKTNIMLGGLSLYNSLGFTTQNASIPTILTNGSYGLKEAGKFKIRFRKCDVPITKKTRKLITIFEVIKELNSPFDADMKSVHRYIVREISELKYGEIHALGTISSHYKPWVRVILISFLQHALEQEGDSRRKEHVIKLIDKLKDKVSERTMKMTMQKYEGFLNDSKTP